LPEPETSLLSFAGRVFRSISPSPEMCRSAAAVGAIVALPEPEISAWALSAARAPRSTLLSPEMPS